MSRKGLSQLKYMRLGEISRFARRLAGLTYLDRSEFIFDLAPDEAQRLAQIARTARGDGPRPILVLGVMPRSGTNFVRDLLAKHPDICADPGKLFEFPLLHAASDSVALTKRFVSYFPRNGEVMGDYDMLARLAGSWLRELQDEAGDRRILLKCPHVQYLPLAPLIFPDADLVLCVRDGRDVVESSQKTFSRGLTRKTFTQLAHEWQLATEAAYATAAQHDPATLLKYEEVHARPVATMQMLVERLGLNADTYPFTEVERMPVRGSSASTKQDNTRWQPEEKTADFQPVGRWQAWKPAQMARFDKIAGETLARAGYQREVAR